MPIQTKITPIANESTWGTTGVKEGSLATGDIGRIVTLFATPASGYKFDGWEVTRVPVTLPVSLYPNVVFGGRDILTICYPGRSTTIGTVLYADGNILYEDPEGSTIARDGYWEFNTDQYIYISAGNVIQSGTCTSISSGGGGGTGDTDTGGGTGGGGGDTIVQNI